MPGHLGNRRAIGYNCPTSEYISNSEFPLNIDGFDRSRLVVAGRFNYRCSGCVAGGWRYIAL